MMMIIIMITVQPVASRYTGSVVRCTYPKLYHRFHTVLTCGNANCEGVLLHDTVTENGETSCYSN